MSFKEALAWPEVSGNGLGFEGVYGLVEKSSKESFCKELGVSMGRRDIPWESVGTGNTSQEIPHLPIPTLPLPSCWSSNTSKEKDNTTPQGQSPSNIGWKSRLDRFTKTPGLNHQENTDLFGSTPQRGPTSREIKAPTLAVEQILKGTMSRGLGKQQMNGFADKEKPDGQSYSSGKAKKVNSGKEGLGLSKRRPWCLQRFRAIQCERVGWVKYDYIPAHGNVGGILILWDEKKVECVKNGVGVRGCPWTDGEEFKGEFLRGVRCWYGEMGYSLGVRRAFNTIIFSEERVGCRPVSRAMEEFLELINNLLLIDLSLTSSFFTWTRSEDSSSRSRLDGFLVSTSREEMAPNVIQVPLSHLLSNHSTILLDGNFQDRVASWWTSYVVEGRPSFRQAKKLKLLKADIRVWNKKVFGSAEVKIREIMNELEELERIEVGMEL
ncbi:hypothetical protein H5410_036331 [Solanum commersonii]|uniref:Uncharacterized protein n=1 Tax=Solanum commersonii TaxID=4109 RepID=A0A9J5Y389_SOLCO|nr:hypothetical protein H5410_036331 [Solanum commersonii]